MNKILITGGGGFIGSHTIVELLNGDFELVVLDNFSNSCVESIDRVQALTGKKISLVKVDIRDFGALDALFLNNSFDAVIHFAGLKSVTESVSQPLDYYDNNVLGSVQLLKAMQKNNVKNIVFSSSATVYGDPTSLPLHETDKKNSSNNPYGRTKVIIEDILKDWYESDNSLSIAILRYFNPVGAHPSGLIGENPRGIPNNLMPYICQAACGTLKTLSVFGDDYDTHDGTGVRDFIHVCDLARGHLVALDKCIGDTGLHVYNLGTGNGTSVRELVCAFEKVNNVSVPCTVSERRAGDVAVCYADTTKIKNELGWVAIHSISDMCRDAWNWQTQNPTGYSDNEL